MLDTSIRNVYRKLRCRRCGGVFTRDQDGDLLCMMCGRPAKARRWQEVEREESLRRPPAWAA